MATPERGREEAAQRQPTRARGIGEIDSGSDPVEARRFSRQQRTPIVIAVLCIVITIVVMQLWLFTATMDAYLNRDSSIIVPAALASLVCLALNVGLLLHLRRLHA